MRRRPPPPHASATAFRAALVAQPDRRRRVAAQPPAPPLTLVPTSRGGNCGFEAVAWALLIARRAGAGGGAAWTRAQLSRYVGARRPEFAARLRRRDGGAEAGGGEGEGGAGGGEGEGGAGGGEGEVGAGMSVSDCTFSTDDDGSDVWARRVRAFERSVLRPGVDGHWLGQCWGDLEIAALAEAVAVKIELYSFDVATQLVRCYFSMGEGRVVRLLFTGTAAAGHFDLLTGKEKWWRAG